jgi:hypothetical protein
VVKLHPDRPAKVANRQVSVQAAVLDPHVIQVAQRLPGEIAQLRMMPLGLKLGNDDDGQNNPVLCEPADSSRISQQDAGVKDVSTPQLA